MANSHKKKGKRDFTTLVFITVLVVLLGFGGYSIVNMFKSNSTPSANNQTNDQPVSIKYEGKPTMGKSDAPIKIIEFGDYRCPHCKLFHDEFYPKLKKDYIDTGKVQFTFASFQFMDPDPLSPAMAAKSIIAQKPEAFWKFYDAVYMNQTELMQQPEASKFLVDLIRKNIPEVNADQVAKDLKEGKYKNEVIADNQYAQSLGLQGVPAVYINGKLATDQEISSYDLFKKRIDQELSGK